MGHDTPGSQESPGAILYRPLWGLREETWTIAGKNKIDYDYEHERGNARRHEQSAFRRFWPTDSRGDGDVRLGLASFWTDAWFCKYTG